MSMFGWMRRPGRHDRDAPAPGSAALARDRLAVLLAHEARFGATSDLLKSLHDKIVTVISRHAAVTPDQVRVRMHPGPSVSTIEIEIEIPA
jgi:cell division topological specificity factor